MCRNIRPLFNFDPPATDEEIRASAVQFVRKVSGFARPSQANTEAFERAVDEVAATARKLIVSLKSAAPSKVRSPEGRATRPGGRGGESARALPPAVRMNLTGRHPPSSPRYGLTGG